MADTDLRLAAFLAAIQSLRASVAATERPHWDAELFNAWLQKIESETGEDFELLHLPSQIERDEYLAALDMCIAFVQTLLGRQ